MLWHRVVLVLLLAATFSPAEGAAQNPAAGAAQVRERPDVVGLPWPEAVVRLRRLDLGVVRRDSLIASGVAEIVLRQIPGPGPMRPFRGPDTLLVAVIRPDTLAVTVTRPLPIVTPVPMRPDVVGLPWPEALARLRRLDLNVVRRDSLIPSGASEVVLRQIPGPGPMQPFRGPDTLMVSRVTPPRLVAVPDLVGESLPNAYRALEQLGLRPGPIQMEYHPSVPPARVARQRPAPGDSVLRETTVDLWQSLGRLPDTARVQVPTLVGLDLTTAETVLADSGLELSAVDTLSEVGGRNLISRQQPAPGTSVRVGSSVFLSLTLALVPEPVPVQPVTPGRRVPTLVGRTREEAGQVAAASELRMVPTRADWPTLIRGTRVTSQTPRPDTVVALGTAIAVTFAWSLPPVVVLSGAAGAAALGLGLTRKRWWRPPVVRLRLQSDSPTIEAAPGQDLLHAELTVTSVIEWERPEVSELPPTGGLISREEVSGG